MSERRSTDLKIERLACVAARGMGMESFLVARPHCDKSHARQLKSPFVVVGENGAGSTVLQQVCSTKKHQSTGRRRRQQLCNLDATAMRSASPPSEKRRGNHTKSITGTGTHGFRAAASAPCHAFLSTVPCWSS